MTSPSSPFLPAALEYAKRGWPVFPLAPKDKVPLIKGGGGFEGATTQRGEVIAYWALEPNANIGIATGHAFDVLDLDGPEAYDNLRQFLAERNLTYQHRGPVSLTGKGLHLLFRPTGQGNRAGLLGKVDFRGKGGYIVAPPSIHPLGHAYRWDYHRRPAITEIPTAPQWLLDLMRKESRPPTPGGIRRVNSPEALDAERVTPLGERRGERPDILLVAERLGLYTVHHSGYSVARCPFHPDRTPSMQMTTHDNRFFCHSCGANGDSVDLEAKRDMHGRTFI